MAEITGTKVLIFTTSAFAVIIAVNLLLAYKAIATFPGLEVENSYVASQTWDAEKKAQDLLGWQLAPSYDPDAQTLNLTFTDAAGGAVQVARLDVLVGRTTEAKDDLRPQFVDSMGTYSAKAPLAPGKWMMLVEAYAADGTLFRQRIDLMVKG